MNPALAVKNIHNTTTDANKEAKKEAGKEAADETIKAVPEVKKEEATGCGRREVEVELENTPRPPRLSQRLENLADISTASPVTSKTIEVKQKLIWLNRLSRSEEL
jgi:hypothetical protein